MTDFSDDFGADYGAGDGPVPLHRPLDGFPPRAGDDRATSRFGRGWIPSTRDIGLPDDDPPPHEILSEGESAWWCPKAGGLCRKPGEGEAAGNIAAVVSHHAWDADRKVRFLHHLSEKGDVRAAAARVGMSRQSAYVLRRRDPVFAQGWQAALVLARTEVEEVLATRAIDGFEEEVWFRGELVGVRKRYDSRLLLAHLARLDALTDTVAGEQAERFDEVLALVAGEAPDASFFRCSPYPNEPDPVLPMAREEFARSCAGLACEEEHGAWREAFEEGEATAEEEPTPDYEALHGAFLESWDTWQGCAFGRVDAALVGAGLSTPVVPAKEAGNQPDSHGNGEGDGSTGGQVGPRLRGDDEKGAGEVESETADHPPIEYKSLTGPGAGFPSGLCKPCQPVDSSDRLHGWTKGGPIRERNGEFAVIWGAGRRGHPPTPPTTAPADPLF